MLSPGSATSAGALGIRSRGQARTRGPVGRAPDRGTDVAAREAVRTAAVLGLLLLHAPSARADLPRGAPSARSVSASARVLGCSPYVVLPCDGITSNRLGANATLLAWRLPEGRGLFGLSLIAAAPTDADITAQVIVVVGYEQRVGARNWIRA